MEKMIGSLNFERNDYATLEDIQATLKDDEYINENGDICCKMCKTERMLQNPYTKHYSRCVCQCQKEANNEADRQAKWQAYKTRLRQRSLLVGKYENATFSNAKSGNADYQRVVDRCKKYVSMPNTILEGGFGIYLYGECGSGKTFITACMANELLDKGYPVIYTNMLDISQWIRSTFNKRYSEDNEENIVDRLSKVSFLFIDDIGTERVVDSNGNENWLQDIIYTIFNNRCTNKKPTIFSSNLKLGQLNEQHGFMRKIAERMAEMTSGAVMELKGKFRIEEIKSKARECPF